MQIFTIGHSNRSLEDFLQLLHDYKIEAVADVRRYPTSRKFPHFNRESLQRHLAGQSIGYRWFEDLGGFRHTPARRGSPNAGLQSPGFRNYADYMATAPFRAAAAELLDYGRGRPTAVMCAEKFYWKCHRRLLSDHLAARGVAVFHILECEILRVHKMTPGAVLTGAGVVIYPAGPAGSVGEKQ